MTLENPHKIAVKDGHLHENAKKDGCLYAVVRVSPVSYQTFFQCTHKIQFISFSQSQNTIHCFFAVTKYNVFLFNNLTKRHFCSLKTH
jgi:hypothetical protein